MQEEVQQRSVTFAIQTTKMTARTLRAAMRLFLRQYTKLKAGVNKKIAEPKHGKQTVKQLAKQNAGMTNVEITNDNIKSFDRVARKYGVDYALKRDITQTPPKYLVFFKARDSDALTAAFKEFAAVKLRKAERPSVIAKLRGLAEIVKGMDVGKVRHKEQERSI